MMYMFHVLFLIFVSSTVIMPYQRDYDNAAIALKEGNWDKASSLIMPLLVDNPDQPDLLYDAGIVSYQKEKYVQAFAYFSKAAEHSGDNQLTVNAHFNAGNTCVALKDLHKAIEYYDHALAIDPENEYVAHNKKIVMDMLKQQEEQQQNNDQDSSEQDQQQDQNQENQDEQSNQSPDNQQDQSNDQGNDQKDNQQDDQSGDAGNNDQDNNNDNSSDKSSSDQSSKQRNKDQRSDGSDADEKNEREKKGNEQQDAADSKQDQQRDGDDQSQQELDKQQQNNNNQQGNDTQHENSPQQQSQEQSDSASTVSSDEQQDQDEADGQGEMEQAAMQSEEEIAQALEKALNDPWLAKVLQQQEERDKATNKQIMGAKIRRTGGGNNVQNSW